MLRLKFKVTAVNHATSADGEKIVYETTPQNIYHDEWQAKFPLSLGMTFYADYKTAEEVADGK